MARPSKKAAGSGLTRAAGSAAPARRSMASAIRDYHAALRQFADLNVTHEGATETAFG